VRGSDGSDDNIFVFDRLNGTTRLVSGQADSRSKSGNEESSKPRISADGRFIVFESKATDLIPGQIDSAQPSDPGKSGIDVFVFDQTTGTTRLVSAAAGSAVRTGNGISLSPVISADGRFIAFTSEASNLTAGDFNVFSDVFLAVVPQTAASSASEKR
jgi:Tol biopolymer transport system component